jgi:hypothetical protein
MVINAKAFVKKNIRSYPKVYLCISFVYSRLHRFFGLIWFKNIDSSIDIESIGSDGFESFKGYYDVSPENSDGLIFVYQTKDDTARDPHHYDHIAICIYESSDLRRPICSRSTRAFNWQQGSRAYWIDNRRLIYNDYCEKRDAYVAKVWDVLDNVIEREFRFAVEAQIDDDRYISLNFKRIAVMRPDYGYFAHSKLSKALFDDDNDGLWIVNTDSGECVLQYSMADIISSSSIEFPEGTLHKLNHALVSPDKKNSLIVHRYFIDGIRRSRLLLVMLDKKYIIEIPTGETVCHYCWLSNDLAIGYLMNLDGVFGYYYIDIGAQELRVVDDINRLPVEDGHPVHIGGFRFVTDSYPDKWGRQKLYQLDDERKIKVIGSFLHGIKYAGESRCDLHPAYSHDSRYLYFDSVFSGKRRAYRLKLSK